MRKRVQKYNIDTSHFGKVIEKRVNTSHYKKIPADQILVRRDNNLHREKTSRLRRAVGAFAPNWGPARKFHILLFYLSLKELQIDHINGDGWDNNRENLRFLCPNCHTQTLNWGSKVLKKPKKSKFIRVSKEKEIKNREKFLITKEELMELVWELSLEDIGKRFGVTGAAIKRRCKKHGIEPPPKGYWLRKQGPAARDGSVTPS